MPFSNISSFISNRFSVKESPPPVNSISFGKIEIDRNWIVQKVHDHSGAILLGSSGLLSEDFTQVLKHIVSKRSYVQLVPVLKTITKNQSVINSAKHKNPFDCLKISVKSQNGTELNRYIRCEFSKSPGFEKNGLWTIVIRDISKAVRLSNKIRQNTEKAELKINTIMSLLQFERDLVKEFLDSTVGSLKDILKSLSEDSNTHRENKNRLESIYCIVHQIKGDAAILNLDAISGEAHKFENHLSKLNSQIKLSKKDFSCLHRPLKSIISAVKEVKDLFEKIVEGGWNNDKVNGGGDSLLRQLQHLIKRLSTEHEKRIIIVDDGLEDSCVPLHLRRLVGRVLTQLARNSVVHGVEDVKTRMESMKMPYGCFHVSVRLLKDHFVLTARDDGRGIDPELVRKAALDSNLFDSKVVVDWNKTQLLNSLFKPGFSTSKVVTHHAGRGIGLDVVKSSVEKYGGKIGIKSTLGQFTEFTMAFPR